MLAAARRNDPVDFTTRNEDAPAHSDRSNMTRFHETTDSETRDRQPVRGYFNRFELIFFRHNCSRVKAPATSCLNVPVVTEQLVGFVLRGFIRDLMRLETVEV